MIRNMYVSCKINPIRPTEECENNPTLQFICWTWHNAIKTLKNIHHIPNSYAWTLVVLWCVLLLLLLYGNIWSMFVSFRQNSKIEYIPPRMAHARIFSVCYVEGDLPTVFRVTPLTLRVTNVSWYHNSRTQCNRAHIPWNILFRPPACPKVYASLYVSILTWWVIFV